MTTNNVDPTLSNDVPKAGTVLASYCSGNTLVKTIADGNGGIYLESIPDSNVCRTILPPLTISKNSTNLTINVSSLNGYINGHSDITITILKDVHIYSDSIGIPALSIIGSNINDNITLINNGYILGIADSEYRGPEYSGPGLYIESPVTLTNNGYICGGPNDKNVLYYTPEQSNKITPGGPAILLGKNGNVTYTVRGTIWGDTP